MTCLILQQLVIFFPLKNSANRPQPTIKKEKSTSFVMSNPNYRLSGQMQEPSKAGMLKACKSGTYGVKPKRDFDAEYKTILAKMKRTKAESDYDGDAEKSENPEKKSETDQETLYYRTFDNFNTKSIGQKITNLADQKLLVKKRGGKKVQGMKESFGVRFNKEPEGYGVPTFHSADTVNKDSNPEEIFEEEYPDNQQQ
jgi:hypothetical protein